MNPHLAQRAFTGRRVLVGVCGGVAAYKTADLVSLLVQAGAEVRVMMTPEASQFVRPLTFEAISGAPVASDLFGSQRSQGGSGGEVHIALSEWPEAILCTPATANFIAKLAAGLADEVVSTTVLASAAPLVLAPAMHDRMWAQPATLENVAKLTHRGVVFAGPVEGRLASGEVGMGRLADPEIILRALRGVLPGAHDMDGLRVVVSAGGTREALDPVRYIGNRSSGLMGHAIAASAEGRGATTVLVTASGLPAPLGVEVIRVDSAHQMAEALQEAVGGADILVMTAAVADFRPAHAADEKIPKADMPSSLQLEVTEDILAGLSRTGSQQMVRVGFAAETGDLRARAQEKLVRKGVDLIVANDVSDPTIGMGSLENAGVILFRDGRRTELERAPKEKIADQVLDAALTVLREGGRGRMVS